MTSSDHRWTLVTTGESANRPCRVTKRKSTAQLIAYSILALAAAAMATCDAKSIYPSAVQRNGDVEYFGKTSATKMPSGASRSNYSSTDAKRTLKSKRPLPVRSATSPGDVISDSSMASASIDESPWTGRNPPVTGTGGWKGDPTIKMPSDTSLTINPAIMAVQGNIIDSGYPPHSYGQYTVYDLPGNLVRSTANWPNPGPHQHDRRPHTTPMGKSYSGGMAPAAQSLDGSAVYPPSASGGIAYPPSTSGGGMAYPPSTSGGGMAYPPSTSGGGMAYPPSTSGGGMSYPPSTSGGISYAPSTSGGAMSFLPSTTGAIAFPASPTGGIAFPASPSGGIAFPSSTTGVMSYSPGHYEASPSYNYGSMYAGGAPMSAGGGGGPYGGAMPYPPSSSFASPSGSYGGGAPMSSAGQSAYPPYGAAPATTGKVEDYGFRSFVSKLLALLPLGLLLAVALPNLVVVSSQQRSLSDEAGQRAPSKTLAEAYPILDLIGYYGVDNLQDRSCFDHLVCRTVRLGSREGANVFQKELWALVNRSNDDWAKSVARLDLWKAIKNDQCSTFTCKKKKDPVLIEKDR